MANDILSAEARLLVVKYGYRRVLEAVAASQGATIEQVEEELEKLAASKTKKTPRQLKSVDELVGELAITDEARLRLVRELGAKYESRVFLSTLREISAFLGRHGSSDKKTKSRRDAAPAVLRILGQLDVDQLQELAVDAKEPGGPSDYYLLAHEIMGRQSRR